MPIDEAISLLEFRLQLASQRDLSKLAAALRLGIEALKLIRALRFDGSLYYPNPLPGETEDNEKGGLTNHPPL